MTNRRKNPKPQRRETASSPNAAGGLQTLYESAGHAAAEGQVEEARRVPRG